MTTETQTMRSVSEMLDRLEQFNAKERYWLLLNVLGYAGGLGAAALPVSRDVVRRWAARVDLDGPAADTRIVAALDYHLSWLHAAFSGEPVSGARGWIPGVKARQTAGAVADRVELEPTRARFAVERNQEDIDFLLAWEPSEASVPTLCLLLVEAKGVTSFLDGQTQSKVERLQVILPRAVEACRDHGIALRPAVLLVSPGANATDTGIDAWKRAGITVEREALSMRDDLWRVRTRGGGGDDANDWRITRWARSPAVSD